MFVDTESTITVTVFYKKNGRTYNAVGKTQITDMNKEEKEKFEKEKSKYKELNVEMRMLGWGLFNELQNDATVYDDEGHNHFAFRQYKENKLVKLIVKWDASLEKDGKTTPVPVSKENILKLSPQIAETIINEYDHMSYIGEEEEGK